MDSQQMAELVVGEIDVARKSVKEAIGALELRLVQELEIYKTILHQQDTRLDFFRSLFSSLSNKIGENNLQIAAVSEKMDALLEYQYDKFQPTLP